MRGVQEGVCCFTPEGQESQNAPGRLVGCLDQPQLLLSAGLTIHKSPGPRSSAGKVQDIVGLHPGPPQGCTESQCTCKQWDSPLQAIPPTELQLVGADVWRVCVC